MLLVALIIGLIVLLVVVSGEVISRDEARSQADEFISGVREPNTKDINKCIKYLQTANRILLDKNETDRRRVEMLLASRDNKESFKQSTNLSALED